MPVIAVDGPAASGKGTIARALAAHYGLPHMDTGLLYRATALNLLALGRRPGKRVRRGARRERLSQIDFADPELKSETVSAGSPRASRPIRWSARRCSSASSASPRQPAAPSSTAATSAP